MHRGLCVWACAYVRMCVCAYVRMCVCAYVRMCVCAYVRMCVCVCVLLSGGRALIRFRILLAAATSENSAKAIAVESLSGIVLFLTMIIALLCATCTILVLRLRRTNTYTRLQTNEEDHQPK